MAEGFDPTITEEDVPLFFLSTQASCVALATLANNRSPDNAREQVQYTLQTTSAINEVVQSTPVSLHPGCLHFFRSR